MDTKKIETVLTTVTIDSKVDSGKIDVVVGESAKMDVVKAVNYIQSGKAEIEAGVTEVLNQVDNHVAEKTAEFDLNASNKTGNFNDNYTNKLNAFNQNASDKTDAFDLNASNKTGDFNDNYVEKKALIDAEVAVAEGYSAEAKQWAIGEPTEPSEGSAKYWAEQASRTLPNDGQLDIQVNGSSVATFTANQSGNTTANIVVGSGLPDQTGNAGKVLNTDGTDASWQYSIKDKGFYNSSTQYYPGDVVLYYYEGQYLNFLCKQASVGNAPGGVSNDYWCSFENNKFILQKLYGDYPIMPFMKQSSSGTTIYTVSFIPGSTSTYNNFPTINTSTGLLKAPSGIDGYYTSAQVDALIPTVNDSTITFTQGGVNKGSFTLNQSSGATIALDAGGTADLDGVTIDTNSDDELEAIGTINKNTAVGATAVKYDWIGTLAEYNAQNVETLHPEWVCYITDDVSGGTSVYTKAEVDSAISTALTTMLDSAFPVGSRYITEASTCPLATLIPNSTWVLTSQGRVIQGADSNHLAGTTAEAGLPSMTTTGAHGHNVYIWNNNNSDFTATKWNGSGSSTEVASNGGRVVNGNLQWNTSSFTTAGAGVFSGSGDNAGVTSSTGDHTHTFTGIGTSTTVQPPAEFVNIFKRTA